MMSKTIWDLGSPLRGKTILMDTSNRAADGAWLPEDIKRNLALDNGVHGHGRTCVCYPCQQSNYRMDRDDPSVGGDEG
jgi:hypothetical protein